MRTQKNEVELDEIKNGNIQALFMNAMIAPNIPTKPSADRLLLRMEKRDLAGEYSVHFLDDFARR